MLPTFTLTKTPMNSAIADYIKTVEEVKVHERTNKFLFEFPYRFELSRLHLESVIPGLGEDDWRRLYREIGQNLKGCKIFPPRYKFNPKETWVIRFHWQRDRRLEIKLDPLEDNMIRKAAKLSSKRVSDFVRAAITKAVDEEFEKEALRKQEERERERHRQSKKAQERYVT